MMTNIPNIRTRDVATASEGSGKIDMSLCFHPRAVMYRVGLRTSPALTALIATRAFSRTRLTPFSATHSLPLGSRLFSIDDPEVQYGYLWPGEGPTVLLIHGWSADSTSMLSLVRPLLSSGFQVAAFDAPGHGASKGKYTTMTRFVQAGLQAVASVGNVEFIVGHSLGAIVAVAVAARARQELQTSIRAMVTIAAPPSLADVLEIWSSSKSQQLPRRLRDLIYARLHQDNGVPVSHWDIPALSSDLRIPTLVMHDKSDSLIPFTYAEQLHKQLGSVFESFSGYGHSRILASTEVKSKAVAFLLAHQKKQCS
ncbi:alpha/beta fold hydrolase [Alcaligenes aquatilis]|uniref:alpha/beta fold hydrolase n=1 Tax=Alcaligenes aquatilis TaxID=323284 RepID=UPI003613EB34